MFSVRNNTLLKKLSCFIKTVLFTGIPHFHRMTEHLVPKRINSKWKETHTFKDNYDETKTFLAQLGEKDHNRTTYQIK